MISMNTPSVVRIGADAALQLQPVLALIGRQRPFYVIDPHFRASNMVARIGSEDGIEEGRNAFFGVVPDPTTASVEQAVALAKAGSADAVVGIGGGSAIDTAKAVALLAVNEMTLSEWRAPRRVTQAGLPLVAIPTTAGTGSEATQFCLMTDSFSGEKMVCMGEPFMPSAALVDYTLTVSLPHRLTADTGIDAFTHALEARVGRKANCISTLYAGKALSLIADALPALLLDLSNRAARADMMLGSFLAGTAFSNSGVALVHAMSVPFSRRFHLSHGLSIGLLLPWVTRFSAARSPAPYAEISRLLGIEHTTDDEVAAAAFVDWLLHLTGRLSFPTLSSRGVEQDAFAAAIPAMAREAPRSGSAANNPAIASVEDIESLYRQVWV